MYTGSQRNMREGGRKAWVIAAGCVLVLGACVSKEENRGYAMEFARLEEIHPGSSKEEVMRALGSPSTTSAFGDEKWYYIGLKLRASNITRPKVAGEDVIIVNFAQNGNVASVERTKGEDRRDISISKESTPTEGQNITVMGQLLGNLGKFNAPKEAKP